MEINEKSNNKENHFFINESNKSLESNIKINDNHLFELSMIHKTFSENIFKNINRKELNNIKCKYCDQIPLFPKIIKQNNEIMLDNNKYDKIICNECYSRLNNDKYFFNGKKIEQKNSFYLEELIGNLEIFCPNSNCKWELISHLKIDCEYQK